MTTNDQVQRRKIIKDASTSRNLVTSLLTVQSCKRTSKTKQVSNPVSSETRSIRV